jgi:hypothetical protein
MPARRILSAVLAAVAMTTLASACSKGSGATTTDSQPGVTRAATSGGGASGGSSVPPVTDADALRDQLLQMAKSFQFTPDNKDFGLVAAWQHAFPNMKVGPFDFSEAAPDTFSFGQSYTFPHNSKDSHGYDQVMGIAVEDTSGTCAGGAVVIPQAGDFTPAPDNALPTVFVPVDMSSAKKCTAEVANDTYGRS